MHWAEVGKRLIGLLLWGSIFLGIWWLTYDLLGTAVIVPISMLIGALLLLYHGIDHPKFVEYRPVEDWSMYVWQIMYEVSRPTLGALLVYSAIVLVLTGKPPFANPLWIAISLTMVGALVIQLTTMLVQLLSPLHPVT